MEEIIKAENILEKNTFNEFLCKSCGNSSTNLQLCQKCDQAYCYSCSLDIKLCLSCKDNLNFRNITKGELKFLKSMEFTCKNSQYGCSEVLNYETVISHHNQCEYNTVNCQACNRLFLVSQIQQHHTDCTEFKRTCQECSYTNIKSDFNHNCQIVLLKHTVSLIQSESTALKQQIISYHKETTEDFKQLKSSLNDTNEHIMSELKSMAVEITRLKEMLSVSHLNNSKCCVVCRVKGRSVLCSNCNFKSCNSCYETCLVCNKNFCLNCSEFVMNCKLCEKGVCKECSIDSSNLKKALTFCSSCNKSYCKEEHELQLCSDCNKPCCFDCFIKCSCELKLCRNCGDRKSENNNSISSSGLNCNHNQSVLVGCYGGKVINLDPRNMKLVEDYKVGENNGYVNNILMMADKTVTGIYNDKVSIWNDRKFTSLNYNLDYKYTRDIRHFKDSQVGIANESSDTCVLIDVITNKILCEHSLSTYPLTLCKVNDSTMLVGCSDGSIKLWNTYNNSSLIDGISAHSNKYVNSVVKLDRWNEQFASSGWDGLVKLWTLDGNNKNITEITSKRISNANVVHSNWSKLKELKDGRIVHCTKHYSVSIWDIKSLTNILMKSHPIYVYDFFELSDNHLLSCSDDKTIKKWDLRKHETPCGQFNYNKYIYRFQSNK